MGVALRKQKRRLEVFEDAYTMWAERHLTQEQAADLLRICARTLRRWVDKARPTQFGRAMTRGLRIDLDAILSELRERTVGRDICVRFDGLTL